MTTIIAVSALLLIFNFCLWFIQSKLIVKGSDHPYHFGLIRRIKANRHRFVDSHPGMMGDDNFSYPQFFHFLLSFLPLEFLKRKYGLIGLLISSITLIIFLSLANLWLNESYGFQAWNENYLFWLGLIFLLTPFSWAIWNAKNSGISARGLGILLILIYQFSLTFTYEKIGYTIFLLGLLTYLILITSQFAFQYVLFSALFYTILLGNVIYILVPFVGTALFFLFHFNVALGFFKGQYWHKRFYSRFLAERFILKKRFSIWRDFIYDFYKVLSDKGLNGLIYIYHNPLISIILCIPLLGILLISTLLNYQEFQLSSWNVHIVVGLILFILTSFRFSRFLGEPERYVEYAIPFVTLLGFDFLIKEYGIISIYILIFYQVSLLIVQFILLIKLKKMNTSKSIYTDLRERFGERMSQNGDSREVIKIFSNNIQAGKYFIDEGFEVLWLLLSNKSTGGINNEKLIAQESYNFAEDSLINLININKIDWFILDKSLIKNGMLDLSVANFNREFVDKFGEFELYRVRYKD